MHGSYGGPAYNSFQTKLDAFSPIKKRGDNQGYLNDGQGGFEQSVMIHN